MPQPKALLIMNPAAGKQQGRRALYPLISELCRAGYRATVFVTAARGEATEAAKTAADYDLVLCCGGDGTLNEVINGLLSADCRTPLSYIPAGSTNDFANSLHISPRPAQALQSALAAKPTAIDVGRFGEKRWFSYIASFGAFTAASYNAPQAVKNTIGHLAYILEGIKEFSSIHPYRVRVESAEYTGEGEYLFGAVCNSTSVGGLVHLKDGVVDMSDGLFEVVLVRRPRNAADFGKIVVSLNSGNFDPTMFDFFKTDTITFHTETPLPWSLDGEQVDSDASVTVSNCPGVLQLLR